MCALLSAHVIMHADLSISARVHDMTDHTRITGRRAEQLQSSLQHPSAQRTRYLKDLHIHLQTMQ